MCRAVESLFPRRCTSIGQLRDRPSKDPRRHQSDQLRTLRNFFSGSSRTSHIRFQPLHIQKADSPVAVYECASSLKSSALSHENRNRLYRRAPRVIVAIKNMLISKNDNRTEKQRLQTIQPVQPLNQSVHEIERKFRFFFAINLSSREFLFSQQLDGFQDLVTLSRFWSGDKRCE